MNIVSIKLIFLVLIVSLVSLSGCTTSEEKETVEPEKLSEPAAPAEAAKPTEAEKVAEPAPEVKEESVVEVIPSKSAQEEQLTIEPIVEEEPEPQVAEQAAPEDSEEAPVAEKVTEEVICLPMFSDLTIFDQNRVMDVFI